MNMLVSESVSVSVVFGFHMYILNHEIIKSDALPLRATVTSSKRSFSRHALEQVN